MSITPLDTPQGLRYRLTPRERGGGTVVPPRTLVALLLMDGRRTLADVHDALDELAIKLPDPAKLLAMIRVFESAGVVEVAHHYSSPEPLRHVCEGCGQSCEGHLVGPIDSAEATHLEAHLIELRGMFSDLPPGPATIETEYEGVSHRVLNFPGGACIFLDEAKRCRLHANFGPHSKPLPCRMFPLRLVRTETGTRVAISPRCFRAHHSYRQAPPTEVEALLDSWGVWRPPALVQGLDSTQSEGLALTDEATRNLADERLVLGLLEAGTTDLPSLLAKLASGDVAAPAPTEAARRTLGEAVLQALQAALGDRFSAPRGEHRSGFGLNVAASVNDVPRLKRGALPDWAELPAAALDYALHGLRHFVFAREVMTFGSVRGGVLAYTIGVMVARWLTSPGASGALDDFVTRLTVWIRLASSREFQAVLFPSSGTIDELLALLRPGSTEGGLG